MYDLQNFSWKRVFIGLLAGGALFVSGVYVGYTEMPTTGLIAGIKNMSMPSAQVLSEFLGGRTEVVSGPIGLCVNAEGKQYPCLDSGTSSSVLATGTEALDEADFDQFWRAWYVIDQQFVPTHKGMPTKQERVWGAIQGLATSLGDPYTFFMPPQEKKTFEQDVQGVFGGVGMQIGMKDGLVTVIAPLKGSPAERAGILKGDKVLKIDTATTTEMSIDKALYLIRGEVGKTVVLTLLHEGGEAPYTVSIVREEIKVPTIDTEKKGDTFIIRLYGFPATGADLFRNALNEFAQSGANNLVLDLRGNPGGYLEVSVDMASWFLPEGKVIVKEIEKDGTGQTYRSAGYDVFKDVKDFHFVILIDGGSASAAEILAGSLNQHGIATLVGKPSFGKGSVQQLIPITPDTALKVTIARWFTPNGTSISDGGITPDVEVDITKENVEKGEDPQLDKAIELFTTKPWLK